MSTHPHHTPFLSGLFEWQANVYMRLCGTAYKIGKGEVSRYRWCYCSLDWCNSSASAMESMTWLPVWIKLTVVRIVKCKLRALIRHNWMDGFKQYQTTMGWKISIGNVYFSMCEGEGWKILQDYISEDFVCGVEPKEAEQSFFLPSEPIEAFSHWPLQNWCRSMLIWCFTKNLFFLSLASVKATYHQSNQQGNLE